MNGKGLRFVNEDSTYAYGFRAIFNQEKQLNKPTYQIFGQTSISEKASPWSAESLDKDVKNGLVIKASSLKELASLIDIPVINLVNSVICFAKNSCEFSIIASIIYVFMIMHNLFVLAFNYSISSGGFHTI